MIEIHVGKEKQYKTINEALKDINGPALICLDDETYNEKVVIDKEDIVIDGQNKATIVFNDYANKIHADGRQYITFRTYTVLVKAKNVSLKNLTIENGAGFGPLVGQAVALNLYNDNINLDNVTLIGYQDTLFIGPLPKDLEERYVDLLPLDERVSQVNFNSTFNNCKIFGNVDFIFGGGNATFNNCKIISVPSFNDSYVCAPSHDEKNDHGFIFNNCEFLKVMGLVNKVYLARPWRDYGYVTFNNCFLDNHIHENGFSIWDNTNRHEHARFIEINSKGPGKNDDKRVSWVKVK